MTTPPPDNRKTVCVDFDDTIVPWGPLMADSTPFPGVPEAIRRLRDRGFRIVIFTSRMSGTWFKAANPDDYEGLVVDRENQRAHVAAILDKHGIPYDEITAEKVPALAYFDDRAVHVEPGDLATEIDRWLRPASTNAA